MATKAAQETAKKQAAKIAEEAKASRKTKAAPQEAAKKEDAKTEKAEDKAAAPMDETANTPKESEPKKSGVNAKTAKEFQDSSNEEDVFLRRSIHLPGKRVLRKTFEQEEIIGDEFDEIVSDGKQRELEYQVLSDSAKAKSPKRLLGRVKGIEPVYGADNKILTYEAKVSLIMNPEKPEIKALMKEKKEPTSIYSVYIPAPMFFFMRRPEQFEGPEGMRNLLRVMRSKINAIVEFVVYDIRPDDNRVIGSRIRAMQLKAHEYYLDPRTKKIAPGTKAYARVTETGQSGITVEVCGAECFIHNSELSWLHLNNASEMFKVGQSIPVVVKSVDVGKIEVNGRNTAFVDITASVKEAKKNPMELYDADYNIGAMYPGVVTYRLPEGLYIVRIDDKVECICYPPAFGTPGIGTEVSITLKDKGPKGYTGNFVYIA